MIKNKVAFLTTIFPMSKQFICDFFSSLEKQTDKTFDVVVLNDGYCDFDYVLKKYSQALNIIEVKYSNTPAKNREFGINYCIEKDYDILIFGDSDDYFARNRIEKSLELLEDYDIVVNDLTLFDENGIYKEKYLSNRLKNSQVIDFEFIKDKNIFGLSNSAIRLDCLDKIQIDESLVAVDWYIFSIILLNNKKAIFTNETTSYYRQYKDNTIGFKKPTKENFEKILYIKRKHYDILKKNYSEFNLEIDMLNGIKFSNLKHIKYPLWWELI